MKKEIIIKLFNTSLLKKITSSESPDKFLSNYFNNVYAFVYDTGELIYLLQRMPTKRFYLFYKVRPHHYVIIWAVDINSNSYSYKNTMALSALLSFKPGVKVIKPFPKKWGIQVASGFYKESDAERTVEPPYIYTRSGLFNAAIKTKPEYFDDFVKILKEYDIKFEIKQR